MARRNSIHATPASSAGTRIDASSGAGMIMDASTGYEERTLKNTRGSSIGKVEKVSRNSLSLSSKRQEQQSIKKSLSIMRESE